MHRRQQRCERVIAQCEAEDLPRDEANVRITNTLDALTTIDLKAAKIKAWLCDEFTPSDHDSQIYISNDILKCMLTVPMNSDCRARNQNLRIPAGIPRIITSNAKNGAEWVGRKLSWSEPIRRKAVFFNLSGASPLVAREWWEHELGRNEASQCHFGRSSGVGTMSSILAARAALVPVPEPEPPTPRSLICPLRR